MVLAPGRPILRVEQGRSQRAADHDHPRQHLAGEALERLRNARRLGRRAGLDG
jgi:hypothetical protein